MWTLQIHFAKIDEFFSPQVNNPKASFLGSSSGNVKVVMSIYLPSKRDVFLLVKLFEGIDCQVSDVETV